MVAEWRETTLGDIATFVNGDRGKNYPSGEDFVADGIPFISAADIADGGVSVRSAKRISRRAFERLGSGKVQRGDVLFCLRGSLGKAGRVERIPEGAIASSLVIVRARQTTDARFLYYVLQGPGVQGVMSALDNGSVQPNLSVREISRIVVPDLNVADQRAIAHFLGTLDDKIEVNRRMSETLEAMARALFKSWFVDFDPVRAKAEGQNTGLPRPLADLFPDFLEDSELGEIPKGWTATPLYDLATFVNGAAYAVFKPNEERRGLPIVKIAELKAGVTDQTKFSDVRMPEKYLIADGDILFSWSGNPDTSIDTFVWSHGQGWLNQHIFRVQPRRQFERSFVLSSLKHLRPVFAEIARNKQTTGLGHVTVEDMKQLYIARPDDQLIRAWDAMVGPLHARAFQNAKEAAALSAIRRALLPKIISGEVRVPALPSSKSEPASC